ncbi:hypothetical protein DSO57_1012953 [Entomophthora muscae]|uniref:Uncharacterized protein n=1 Tax=Entomophthora muscae TaxID=34485 RepID=A0ACC2TGJ9_9FUNG|nr:hypothetical protein DSO57_1012953 [Entomophthora muscae]
MMAVYPIVTVLTGFQVANLVPYFAKILPQLLDLYTCTRETELTGHEGTVPPLLFCNKNSYLPAYLVPMTISLTLRPNCSQEYVATGESTSTKIFGVMYITLTGLINSMVLTSRPWATLGKSLSYNVKLAPILWWALPSGLSTRKLSGTYYMMDP